MPHNDNPPRPCILIVEDDARTRRAMAKLLAAHGYDICAAATVAEALEKLDGQAFAVLDLNLPDGLGTQVLRRIRDEKRPVRVAVATGTSDRALLDEALRSGAELVLRKPLNVSALLTWLRTPR